MESFTKIGIEEIKFLSNYLLQNRNNGEFIINDLGVVSTTNGYGSTFLTPYDPLFKTICIHEIEGKAQSLSFGGPKLGLTLLELVTVFKFHTEHYSRYDDGFHYFFYEKEDFTYTIRVFSKSKLFDGDKMLDNIEIGGISISLK